MKKQNRRSRRAAEFKKDLGGEVRVINQKHTRERKPPVVAKNEVQSAFLKALKTKQVIVFSAAAGVGKSYLTMSECTDWLKKGIFNKLILSRPAVGMGNSLQALPGDLRAKFEPYLLPCVDVIKGRYGVGFYESSLRNGTIEFAPLEFIRGRSFSDLVVIDEGQNVKPEEMYTILTRIEEGGKLIIIGDPTQNDLRGENGIDWLVNFVDKNPELASYIEVIKATSDDIVRSGLCKAVVKAKEKIGRI